MLACDTCGQYFSEHRLLLSHRARKHPELVPPKRRISAAEYASCTVDGMPQCARCGKKFTRVEGLKKHLQKDCRHAPASQHASEAVVEPLPT